VLAALATLAAIAVGAAPAVAASGASPTDVVSSAGAAHHPKWTAPHVASADATLAADAAKGPVHVIAQLDSSSLPSTAVPQARAAAVTSASARVAAALPKGSVSHVQALGTSPMVALTVDAAGLTALRAQPDVVHVQRNHASKISTTFSTNLNRVGAPTAWAAGDTGAGQTIAIVDTGVDKTNPFLAGKVVAEGCFSGGGGAGTSLCPGGVTSSTASGSGVNCALLADGCFHGTHVAGIAAGGNGGGFSGVAPGAKLIAIDVFTEDTTDSGCSVSSPCVVAFDSDIISALSYVYSLRNSFNIAAVNMSLGYLDPSQINGDAHCDNNDLKPSIDQLRGAGIATVIASGNDGTDNVSVPACISTAVAVGSVDADSNLPSFFTDSSPALTMWAPGAASNDVGIISSVPAGTVSVPGDFTVAPCPAPYQAGNCADLQGTSMATPHAAGAFAVLRQAKPGMAVSNEIDQLQATGVNVPDQDGFDFPSLNEGTAVTQMRPISFGGGVTANKDGRLEAFQGTPSGVQHKWQLTPNGRWSAWSSLGGPVHGAPVVVTDYDGRVEAFGTASNGALYHAWQLTAGGHWSGWASLGGSITSGHFSVFMNPDGRLEMFTATSTGDVQHQWQTTPGGQWSGWKDAGLTVVGLRGIMTIRPAGGIAFVLVISTTGLEWANNQMTPGGQWAGWAAANSESQDVNGNPIPLFNAVGTPTFAQDQDGRFEVLTSDANGRLWTLYEGYYEGQFAGLSVAVSANITSGNLTVGRNSDGRLEVFDVRSDGTVVHAWQNTPGGGWSAANLLPSSIGGASPPLEQLADLDGRLELFSPQSGKHNWQTKLNGPWSGWAWL
jgi:subtilisin family serine protease